MKKIKLLSTTLLLGFSLQSYAQSTGGDEEVNCSERVVSIPYYYGSASCFANGHLLTKYVDYSVTPSVQISENLWNGSSFQLLSCNAHLPHSGIDQRVVEDCQYTPKATIRTHYIEESYDNNTGTTYYQVGVIVAAFEYSDRDGHITNVEKWVNGNSISAHHVDIYEPSQVRLRVTDNDGNVTDITSNISPPLRQICQRAGILVRCEGPR